MCTDSIASAHLGARSSKCYHFAFLSKTPYSHSSSLDSGDEWILITCQVNLKNAEGNNFYQGKSRIHKANTIQYNTIYFMSVT